MPSVGDQVDVDQRQAERRHGERRGTKGLGSNLQWTVASGRRSGAKRFNGWRPRMKLSRAIPLVLALLAGGAAAYLATSQSEQPAAQPAVVVAQETTRVLVASRALGAGERLSPNSVAWEEWPLTALQSDYITLAAAPAAITDMSGSIVRSEFFPGDPIRAQKLVESANSFLPALLDGGKRGVSVAITAESASGGFINPGDRVDVVLTRLLSSGENGVVTNYSRTILHSVQVLAIDERLGAAGSPDASENLRADNFSGQAIATLALDASEAELIVNAGAIGKLSLLLRSAIDLADNDKSSESSINQAIRLSSPFWSR